MVEEIDAEGRETEYGRHMRWLRQAPDLFERHMHLWELLNGLEKLFLRESEECHQMRRTARLEKREKSAEQWAVAAASMEKAARLVRSSADAARSRNCGSGEAPA